MEDAAVVARAQGAEPAIDAGGVFEAGDADVDFRLSFGGNDVGAGSAADDSGVDSEAAVKLSEAADFFELVSKLMDGAVSALEVDAGMRSDAFDANDVAADSLAGGFVGAV
jgi:hypothetical protein